MVKLFATYIHDDDTMSMMLQHYEIHYESSTKLKTIILGE
jgi:hypothetical protein